MGYLGNRPAESYASFERQVFTIVNSQTAYTLSHSVVNENDIRLVVNNVVQEPGSGKAYTASGTTLTLSAALVNGTDEMYCVFLGRALQTVNPPNASVGTSQLAATSVTAAKLNDDIISGQTALGATPADTDEFLVSDAGVLKRMDYSYIKASSDFVKLGETGAVSAVDKIELNGFFSSTYKTYKIYGQNCYGSSGGAQWQFQYNTGASYTALTSGYYYINDGGTRTSSSQSYNNNNEWNTTRGRLGWNGGGSSSYPCMFEMIIDNPAGSTRKNAITQMGGWDNSSQIFTMQGFNHNNNTTAITGIRFLTNAGTMYADNLAIFGLKY